jgi:hypothetical protein
MNFSALAEKNADHFNEHPVQHTAITVVLAYSAIVVSRRFVRRIAREELSLRSGQYA